ncbi:hypothetical protein LSAT2_027649, partial [Lamellibrachia satsuma]
TRHPNFKDPQVDTSTDIIAELKDPILNHGNVARHGMEQVPIKVTFTRKEIDEFELLHVATQCGLMTESREPGFVMFRPTVTSVFYFLHLTLQEFLAAIALLTDVKRVRSMMSRASERQLDLLVMFMAGMLGNDRTHTFLDALQLKPTVSVDELLNLVVERERRNESSIEDDEGRSTAHKGSILLLVMILYESQQAVLWSHVSDYALKGGKELDLESQHISPTEVQALAFVLPEMGIEHLNFRECGITGREAEHLIYATSQLHQLKYLRLDRNPLGPAGMTALVDCMAKLTNLELLGLAVCRLTDDDVSRLPTALPMLSKLKRLWLSHNNIGDVGALEITEVAVTLPDLELLGLNNNWVTVDGITSVRQAARAAPGVWLVW